MGLNLSDIINIGVTDLVGGCHTMAEEGECDNIPKKQSWCN